MATNYVLIDFENVQPKNLELLEKHPFKVFIFVGANQAKVPFDMAETMQRFGANGKYIKIAGSGKNALDFHIACYLGKLSTEDPKGVFHVISRDKGFDLLINHLRDNGIQVQRVKDLAEMPALKISATKTPMQEKVQVIVKNLKNRGQSRPRKVDTLSNTIKSLFAGKMEQAEINQILNTLQQKKYIAIKDKAVTYSLDRGK